MSTETIVDEIMKSPAMKEVERRLNIFDDMREQRFFIAEVLTDVLEQTTGDPLKHAQLQQALSAVDNFR